MIHSLSGGVIRDYGSFVFAKVVFDDAPERPYWYISDFDVAAGDRVTAPLGSSVRRATVIKVEENVSGQVTPIPLRSAKKLIAKIVE